MGKSMKNRPPCPSEHAEQTDLFVWADQAQALHPELRLLNGSLNGVRLTIGQAVKAKKAGLKPGFPDISLPIPRGKYHGLYIELKKVRGGSVSKEQRGILNQLCQQGYYACVCRGAVAAIEVIIKYLTCKLDIEGVDNGEPDTLMARVPGFCSLFGGDLV